MKHLLKIAALAILSAITALGQGANGVGAPGISTGSAGSGGGGGGGGGTPGGSTTQLQYNNAGSFGGTSSATFDNTTGFLTFSLQPILTRTALAGGTALALETAYTDALSANRVLTITGTPTNGNFVQLEVNVTNSPVLDLTAIPSIIEGSGNVSAQTTYAPVNGPQTLTWQYLNSAWHLYSTSVAVTGSGGVFVQSNGPQIANIFLSGGLTASGSIAFDWSGANAAFKTSTGAVTLAGPATASSTFTSTGLLTASAHTVFEGVTSTGATGTGALVYSISPAFTGTPTAPTATVGTNTTQLATTAFVLANAGGGSTGANPTALVGLAAVNGSATTFLRSDGAPALDQSIQPTWTGTAGHIFQKNALAATTAPMLTLQNTTLAAAGAQQVSPAIYQYGASWMTTGGTSTVVGIRHYANGIQGSSTPVASWALDYSVNAGSTWTNALFFSSSSGFSFANTFTGTNATLSGTVAGNVVNATTTISAGTLLSAGGSILSSSATGGVGYKTGAGGAVTQATNRTTGVTLNTVCGVITTNTTSLAAGATAVFTVTDSALAITDVISLSIRSGQVNAKTQVWVSTVAAGSFNITVFNGDTLTGETGAILINFAVQKATSS